MIDHRRHGPQARRAKASVKRKRAAARRNTALFLSPIAVALAVVWAFGQNVPVFASSWRAPLAVLTDRSPGQRDAGALYNTKPPRLVAVNLPHERVLPGVRLRPQPEETELFQPEAPLDLVSDTPILIDTELFPDPTVALLEPVRRIELLTDTPIVPTVVPTAVPEPATWLMYIVGFFTLAGLLRRRPNANGVAVALAAARRQR